MSWGECDLLKVEKSGYLTEFEIKTSVADLQRERKKKRWTNSFYFDKFRKTIRRYFIVLPKAIAEKAAPHIPEAVGAGVMTVAEQQSKYEDWYFGPFTFVLIKPKPNPEAIPVTDAERRSPGPAVVGRGDAI